MKKLYTILGLLCSLMILGALPNTSQAQTKPSFGIRGGANFAQFNNTDINDNARTGLMLGAYLNLAIPNTPISIQPEVLYTQKGAEIKSGVGTSGKVKLNYIEVPVLAKFRYQTYGAVTPSVYFGPAINLNVTAKGENPGSLGNTSSDLDDFTNTMNLSVVVGAGVDISRFNVGVRYNAGLTKAFESGDAKNGVFSVVAGINLF